MFHFLIGSLRQWDPRMSHDLSPYLKTRREPCPHQHDANRPSMRATRISMIPSGFTAMPNARARSLADMGLQAYALRCATEGMTDSTSKWSRKRVPGHRSRRTATVIVATSMRPVTRSKAADSDVAVRTALANMTPTAFAVRSMAKTSGRFLGGVSSSRARE